MLAFVRPCVHACIVEPKVALINHILLSRLITVSNFIGVTIDSINGYIYSGVFTGDFRRAKLDGSYMETISETGKIPLSVFA